MNYDEFIASKAMVDVPTGIEKPPKLNPTLFEFQADITRWALRRGRAAIFAGTGLGKTPMQVETARIVEAHTKKPVLIFAPLAVASQTIEQAATLLKCNVFFAKSREDIGGRGIYITNYQKREHFDPDAFGGVILDESSCLKGEGTATRQALCDEWSNVPFRYCFTATPAPNDFMEIGGHAEFLGVMTTSEMLSTFFVHDGGETQKWRLKGHAEKDFWSWMASWCIAIQHPRDLGYEDSRYDLPPLILKDIIVPSEAAPGELFAGIAQTLQERRGARKASIDNRIKVVADLVNADTENQWTIWCNLNDEGEQLSKAITDCVEVAGRHSDDEKEDRLIGFAHGKYKRLVTKGKIAGWGMNWQNCHKMVYFPDDSFEVYFQAVRRHWRFGQTYPVEVYRVLSESEQSILQNLKRKEAEAKEMYSALIEHMAEISKANLKSTATRTKLEYNPRKEMRLPEWLATETH